MPINLRFFSTLIFLFINCTAFGQSTKGGGYNGLLSELFFERQPSARAEAMGRTYGVVGNDVAVTFFNPAALGRVKNMQLEATYINLPGTNFYSFFGTAYQVNRFAGFGLSRFHFDRGVKSYVGADDKTYFYDTFSSNYGLTFASQPIKNLYLGGKGNYYLYQDEPNYTAKAFTADLGVLQLFELKPEAPAIHTLTWGASFTNLSLARMGGEALPAFYRFDMAYQVVSEKDGRDFMDFIFQMGYKNLVNSRYFTSLHFGGELKVWEVFAIRAGYYVDSGDGSMAMPNGKFTGGFGVQVPIDEFSKGRLPIHIQLDFTRLQIEKILSLQPVQQPMFNTFSFLINWKFKGDKGQIKASKPGE